MAKKSSKKVSLLYLIGMVLVTVGFCVPVFRMSFGPFGAATLNGFDWIDFSDFDTTSLGALLIFAGAVAGLVVTLLPFLKVKIGGANIIRLISLIVSIAGAVIIAIVWNKNSISSAIGKEILKYAFVGFYMIVVGWVAAIVGAITKI